MFYRTTAARSLLRAATTSNASIARSTLSSTIFKAQLTSSARQFPRFQTPSSLALATHKPMTTALVRFSSTTTNKHATDVAENTPVEDADVDMMAGVKNDVVRSLVYILSFSKDRGLKQHRQCDKTYNANDNNLVDRKRSRKLSAWMKFQRRHCISVWRV